MREPFLKCLLLISLILFVIGTLTILFLTTSLYFLCIEVERFENGYTTYLDTDQVFRWMISLITTGSILWVSGLGGLSMGSYLTYNKLEVKIEQ